jgi:hypothetical protein
MGGRGRVDEPLIGLRCQARRQLKVVGKSAARCQGVMAGPLGPQVVEPIPPRKASREIHAPVPQSDTGRRVEYTKAIEETLVKELGKMVP